MKNKIKAILSRRRNKDKQEEKHRSSDSSALNKDKLDF